MNHLYAILNLTNKKISSEIYEEKRLKGVFCKPYLTNKRILMRLLVVPEKGRIEPKSIWYTFPYERINYMRPGRKVNGTRKRG